MNADKTLNDILVKLFNDLMEIEEKCLISGEFMNISGNDMHIIEAIGLGTGNNMSTIAKKLGITVGSLTTSMNSLVNKKYAIRHRSEQLPQTGILSSRRRAKQDPLVMKCPDLVKDLAFQFFFSIL